MSCICHLIPMVDGYVNHLTTSLTTVKSCNAGIYAYIIRVDLSHYIARLLL